MNVINKVKTKNFIFSSTGAAQACESAYGVSKRAAEDVIREYCTEHKPTDYTIFRFYNVIGTTVTKPTNPDGLFYNLIKARDTGNFTIYGNDYPNTSDGTCVRDYVHVEEICQALCDAIEKPANNIECLGHGVGYTVREMAEKFQTINECDFEIIKGPRRKGDIEYYVLEDVSPYMKNLYTIEELLKI
jgi:UDP-glucose 4-epimerase